MSNKIYLSFLLAAVFFQSCSDSNEDSTDSTTLVVEQPTVVTISQKKLQLDGEDYQIKGICYSRGGFGNYTDDIVLLTEANINTIRVYGQITNKAELDAFAAAGIKIIMQLDYGGSYQDYVETYKNHPAILMWEVGNENNYHPDRFGGNLNTWYRQLEEVATTIKAIDSNHPVATAHGEVPTQLALNSCPSVDIWGMNLYRWDENLPAITEFNAISDKPMYVSEAGADSYHSGGQQVREDLQAEATQKILSDILSKSDVCIGVTLFSFCDEWWKAGNQNQQDTGGNAPNSSGVPYDGTANEEYWGIVNRDRSVKQAFETVKNAFR